MADTTYLPLRSRFVYGASGSEIDWETSLSVRPWDRRVDSVGGQRISGAGIPASYIVRKDHILTFTIRFYESEWEEVEALVDWGQQSELMEWFPDALEESVSFDVWLHNPMAGEPLEPTRVPDFPGMMEVTISIRSSDASAWVIQYYA